LLFSYQHQKNFTAKVSKFLQITRIIQRNLKPSQVQKQARLKIQHTLAVPALLYGCETWAITEQNKYRVTSVEMKFVSRAAKYTWQGYKTNDDILSQLKINPAVKKSKNYTKKWV
jgi:hypothetical protein